MARIPNRFVNCNQVIGYETIYRFTTILNLTTVLGCCSHLDTTHLVSGEQVRDYIPPYPHPYLLETESE